MLEEVEILVNDYFINDESVELYNRTNVDIEDNYMTNPLKIEIDHDYATNIEITLSNPDMEVCYIESNGTHTIFKIEKWNNSLSKYTDISVTGNLIETNQHSISTYYDVENGEKITYENALVTPMLIKTLGAKQCEIQGLTPQEIEEIDFTEDDSLARFIGDWYSNRFIYSFNNRGDITKDTNKIVTIETDFNPNLKGFLLENNISYNGAWRGFSKVIKFDDLNNSDDESENGSE